MNKLLFIISMTLLSFISYAQTKSSAAKDTSLAYRCGEMKILDSIRYIYGLPEPLNDFYQSAEELGLEIPKEYIFYPYGDSICKKIILGYGNEIIPCLIERIKDTTPSVIRGVAHDSLGKPALYYTVGHTAILLLPYVIRNKQKRKIYILYLLMDEFHDESDGWCDGGYESILENLLIFTTDEKKKYDNHIRLYNRIKKWYEEEKDNGYLDTQRCKK